MIYRCLLEWEKFLLEAKHCWWRCEKLKKLNNSSEVWDKTPQPTDRYRSSASSPGRHGDLDRHPRLHRPSRNTHLPGCAGVWAKPSGRPRRRWSAPSPGSSPRLSWSRSYQHAQHPPSTRSNSFTWEPITGPPWSSQGRARPPGSALRSPNHLGGGGWGGLEEALFQALAIALQLLQHHFSKEVSEAGELFSVESQKKSILTLVHWTRSESILGWVRNEQVS